MRNQLLEVPPGIAPNIKCQKYVDGQWREVTLSVPQEMPFSIFVNGREAVTIYCTPIKLNFLVLGYLSAEGIIKDIEDVALMGVCEDLTVAQVKLRADDFVLPQKKVRTSGCIGGVSFSTDITQSKISSGMTTSPEHLLYLMQQMLHKAELYHISGGIHCSALCDSDNIIVLAEDIGRHNTLDKIFGECMFRKIRTKDKILITTGRISSEMLRKAVKMQIPIVASLTTPTEEAIKFAQESDVTLIGRVGSNCCNVYNHYERLNPLNEDQGMRKYCY